MAVVECWFDFSSPFGYLGTTQIERVAAEHDGEVVWRPFLLGALFKTIGTPVVPMAAFADSKRELYRLDLVRWSAYWGVELNWSSHFPINTVTALRLALVGLEEGSEVGTKLIHRINRAAWVDDENVQDPAVLGRCLEDVGLDPALLEKTQDPAVKARLKEATDEAIERGVPGAPTFVIGDRLYWGQDRLDFVARALAGDPVGPA